MHDQLDFKQLDTISTSLLAAIVGGVLSPGDHLRPPGGASEIKGGHGASEIKGGHGASEIKGGHGAREIKGGHGARAIKGGFFGSIGF
jgi:Ca2+-binding RTX toxin-like protein